MTMPVPELPADVPTNWGRWGDDDQLGTLNFITDAARARGVAAAATGRTVSLAYPVTPVPLSGPLPFGHSPAAMPAGVLQIVNLHGSPARAATDVLIINTHHADLTHIDAVVHVPSDGRVYPGVPLDQAVFLGSVTHGSTAAFAGGITTRGVLLDLAPGGRLEPGRDVTADDLDAAETQAGLRVESGDALVVRGGWRVTPNATEPLPAMSIDAVRWMADREVSVYAGDISDRPPFPPSGPLAMHQVALPLLGMPLIDGPDVTALAAACSEFGRYSFLFVVGPLPLVGATGMPVNPLAIF